MTWRALSTSERQLAWIWGGLALATAALSPIWVHLAPLLRPCLFRQVTGIPCPSCGATRGVLALTEGRILDALAFNPLVIAGFVGFLVGGVVAPLWAWRIDRIPRFVHPLPRWLRIGAVLAVVANWVWVILAS